MVSYDEEGEEIVQEPSPPPRRRPNSSSSSSSSYIKNKMFDEGVHMKVDKNDMCPICLETFTLETLSFFVCKFKGAHKIHTKCLEKAHKSNPAAACFMCRALPYEETYLQYYEDPGFNESPQETTARLQRIEQRFGGHRPIPK